ncbi:HxxPF-repeated domain-containing protein, partial [Arboricoccus pini]
MSAFADRLAALAERYAAATTLQRRHLLTRFEQAEVAFDDLPIPRADRSRPLPASDAQRRLWFLWRLDPTSPAYTVSGGLRLEGRLDTAALEGAFAGALRRHEVLRTRFREDQDGSLLQIVDAAAGLDFVVHDLAGRPKDEAQGELTLLTRAMVEQPFDLEAGPLLRLALIRLGPEEHVLLMALHHIVCDAWSLDVLTRDVSAGYAALASGRADDQPAPPLQFADWASWQSLRTEAGIDDAAIESIRAELRQAPSSINLPSDIARPASGNALAVRLGLDFPATLGVRVREVASERGLTAHAVLLAAFAVFLSRSSGQADIRIGLPVANRGRAVVQGVVGPFVNTVALRFHIDLRTSFADLLEVAASTSRAALARQDLPFERIAEGLASAGEAPFEAMFGHQRTPLAPSFPGLVVRPLANPPETAKFDVVLGIEESEDGTLEGALILSAARFSPEAGQRLADRFTSLLTTLLASPGAAIGDASMLSVADRDALGMGCVWLSGLFVGLADRVSSVASAFPSRVAIDDGGVEVSYGA